MRQRRTELTEATAPAAMSDTHACLGGGGQRTRMLGAAGQHWKMANALPSMKEVGTRAFRVANAVHHHMAPSDALCAFAFIQSTIRRPPQLVYLQRPKN